MRIILFITLLTTAADARGRKDPSCPEGHHTFVETRISGAANPSQQRHQFQNPKKYTNYDCKRCARGSITVVDGYGWNVCLGGTAKLFCGPHAAPMPTGDPERPRACVPCAPTERKVVINDEERCIPHDCATGTAPARYRGVVEAYRCAEAYEDPDLINWEQVTPPAPKTPPAVPDCGEQEGIHWDKEAFTCQPCSQDRVVLRRNGYPVCGLETPGRCGKGEALLPPADLAGKSRCEKCPRRYRFSVEDGIPRCLKR